MKNLFKKNTNDIIEISALLVLVIILGCTAYSVSTPHSLGIFTSILKVLGLLVFC